MDFECAAKPLIYRFRTRWNIHAPVFACWDVLVARRAWSEWFAPVMLDGDTSWSAQVTEHFDVVVRAPYGAKLRLHLEVIAVREPGEIVLASSGDLLGYAQLRFAEAQRAKSGAELCEVEIEWHVVANSRLLRWGSVLGMRPLFSWAHSRVMRRALAAIRQNVEVG